MMMIYPYVELKFYVCCESVNVADQLRIVNENFFSCVLYVSTLWLMPTTQRPESHGLGQNFEGGAGSRCPAVFSTGYGAHHEKNLGF